MRFVLLAVIVAIITWVALRLPSKPASSEEGEQPINVAAAAYSRIPVDESGTLLILRGFFVREIKDRTSLENIREAWDGIGQRAIETFQRTLAQTTLSSDDRMRNLISLTRSFLFQGEFLKASATLVTARQLAASDPLHFEQIEPSLVFLQGIAALRRGEVENCVECQCRTSCIFPIDAQAVHQKRAGSREAVRFFTEYLQRHPDDTGVKWLLNVAYMTLGEYPGSVPNEYLLAPSLYQSKLDIGRFLDIAARVGVNRLNAAGGAVMDDFDNDGLLDLVVTSCDAGEPMAFFRNRGDGTFEDRSEAAGLGKQLGGLYCVQTDYNNDGNLDLYVCRGAWITPERHSLLRNNGNGTFTDVTARAGLMTPVDSQVAVWADYDNDGWLDLFVGGESVPSRLYHNRGDGTFEEVANKAGVANKGFSCKGANWGDFDCDGLPDLYVSNSTGPPRLFHNNGDGTFTDVAPKLGITHPVIGFSCWFWDYDNDGWPDIFATGFDVKLNNNVRDFLGLPNPGTTTCRLYRNLEGKGFQDVTEAVGLNIAVSPMGSNFLDVDNDGFLDLYLATGGPDYSLLVPNRMYKNVDGKRFVDITTSSGTGHLQKGHAVACGDWDRDGNVDMFEQLGGFVPGDHSRDVLFQNPGHDNHWITVKLIGKKTNRAAIGARIKVNVAANAERSIYRYVTSGSSFGGNTLQQTIGLGKATKIKALEIYWPTSKTTQIFRDVAMDQAIEITEFATDYRRLNWKRIPVPRD